MVGGGVALVYKKSFPSIDFLYSFQIVSVAAQVSDKNSSPRHCGGNGSLKKFYVLTASALRMEVARLAQAATVRDV